MKKFTLNLLTLGLVAVAVLGIRAQDVVIPTITKNTDQFGQKPVLVSLEGISGEAAEV